MKVALGLGGRWWEMDAREFELSLHWLPNLAATSPPYATPSPLPFMEDPPLPHAAVPRHFYHPQNFAGQPVPRGTRWSAKFRGPSCASRHTHDISRAKRTLILQISKKHAMPRGTRQKFRGPSCASRHTQLARLARGRFFDCAPIHSAKMVGWPGWSRSADGRTGPSWVRPELVQGLLAWFQSNLDGFENDLAIFQIFMFSKSQEPEGIHLWKSSARKAAGRASEMVWGPRSTLAPPDF